MRLVESGEYQVLLCHCRILKDLVVQGSERPTADHFRLKGICGILVNT